MKKELIEKIEFGMISLSNKELIEAITGVNTEYRLNELADELTRNVYDHQEWIKLGKHKLDSAGYKLMCALELSRRFTAPRQTKSCISKPTDLIPYLSPWRYLEQEHLLLVTLTGAHEIINIHCVTVGILDNCQVHPRELFKHAIRDNAAAVILAHNHPSGRLEASKLDITMSQVMKRCGELLGIPLLDHIIIGPEDGYTSIDYD